MRTPPSNDALRGAIATYDADRHARANQQSLVAGAVRRGVQRPETLTNAQLHQAIADYDARQAAWDREQALRRQAQRLGVPDVWNLKGPALEAAVRAADERRRLSESSARERSQLEDAARRRGLI